MQWNCANCGASVTVASPLAAGQQPCPHCGRNLVEVEPPPPSEVPEQPASPPPEPEFRLPRPVVGKIVGSIGGALLGGLILPLLAQPKDAELNDYICILTGAITGGFVGSLFSLAMAPSVGPRKARESGGYKSIAADNRTRLMGCIVIGAVLGCKLGTYLVKPSPISMFVGSVSGLFLGAILGGECGVIAGEALEPREPVKHVEELPEESKEQPGPQE